MPLQNFIDPEMAGTFVTSAASLASGDRSRLVDMAGEPKEWFVPTRRR